MPPKIYPGLTLYSIRTKDGTWTVIIEQIGDLEEDEEIARFEKLSGTEVDLIEDFLDRALIIQSEAILQMIGTFRWATSSPAQEKEEQSA